MSLQATLTAMKNELKKYEFHMEKLIYHPFQVYGFEEGFHIYLRDNVNGYRIHLNEKKESQLVITLKKYFTPTRLSFVAGFKEAA